MMNDGRYWRIMAWVFDFTNTILSAVINLIQSRTRDYQNLLYINMIHIFPYFGML